jgi:hypothetical protein
MHRGSDSGLINVLSRYLREDAEEKLDKSQCRGLVARPRVIMDPTRRFCSVVRVKVYISPLNSCVPVKQMRCVFGGGVKFAMRSGKTACLPVRAYVTSSGVAERVSIGVGRHGVYQNLLADSISG